MSQTKTQYASAVTDKEPGDQVGVRLNGEDEVTGTVKEVEATVPRPEFPKIGETVTFKAVSGEVEKTVARIEPDETMPIVFESGGRGERSSLVEYSQTETHKVIELPDGRELWASGEDDE